MVGNISQEYKFEYLLMPHSVSKSSWASLTERCGYTELSFFGPRIRENMSMFTKKVLTWLSIGILLQTKDSIEKAPYCYR